MSMADDNTRRSYRSNDPYRRSANPADAQDTALGGSDPLAELARLIGQADPYTESASARRQPQGGTPQATQHDYDDEPPGDWRRHIQRPNYGEPDEPAFDADPHYATDPHAGHDPYRMATPQPEEPYADPHADHRHQPAYAAAPDDLDEQMYAAQHHGGYAANQHHGGGMGAYGDDGYDDPPRRNRGSSLVTAVVLIGCAMLGTAGAYGYRTYSSGSSSTPAPVIIADSAPNKIIPAEPKSRSQDRIGGQGSDERLVSREEQPVELQPPGSTAVPRVVFPSPVPSAPTTTGTTHPPGSNPQASGGSAEPKRVKTVTIRPENSDVSGRPFNEEPRAAAAPPAARSTPTTVPAQRAPARDQPLSLDPASAAPGSEPARSQQRTVTPPAQREPAAPKLAAVPPNGGSAGNAGNGGGFIVQVSSQRSEADAQASYRALQAKYSQLKPHQPIIRRADLGAKGVFYRAMVGPFESGDEAVQFCNGLKQAGGQCIIHRN